MGRKFAALCAALSLFGVSAHAMAKDFHPEENGFLPCPSGCAKITIKDPTWPLPAVRVDSRSPPDNYIRYRVIVGVDGKVKTLNILRLVGSAEMVPQIKRGLLHWDARATTDNGTSIEFADILMERYGPIILGPIRKSLKDAGKQAQTLLMADRRDEAERILIAAVKTSDQNSNERLFLAGLLGSIEIGKGEFLAAADLLDEPCDGLFENARIQPTPTGPILEQMASLRIQAALGVGDVVTALTVLKTIQKKGDVDTDGHLAAAVANVRSDLDKANVIPVQAVIPAQDVGDGFFFNLYRRHFDFHLLSGALKDYSLSCPQGIIDKPVDEAVRHDVPDDWGASCGLYVTGTPGTTFEVREYKN
jgi:hypothetical protein